MPTAATRRWPSKPPRPSWPSARARPSPRSNFGATALDQKPRCFGSGVFVAGLKRLHHITISPVMSDHGSALGAFIEFLVDLVSEGARGRGRGGFIIRCLVTLGITAVVIYFCVIF